MGVYVYLAIILAAIVLEACTASLTTIWFVPAAIVGIVLQKLGVGVAVQTVVFLVLSAVFMALFYKKLRDIIAVKTEKTGIEALIGKTAIVEEDILPLKPGRVKVSGMSWSALGENEHDEMKKGELVQIMAISGVKLICRKNEQNAVPSSIDEKVQKSDE